MGGVGAAGRSWAWGKETALWWGQLLRRERKTGQTPGPVSWETPRQPGGRVVGGGRVRGGRRDAEQAGVPRHCFKTALNMFSDFYKMMIKGRH